MPNWRRLSATWRRPFPLKPRSRRRDLEKALLRLKRARSWLKDARRRSDALQKLQLGGLISVAGLREVSPFVILGGLLELRARLTQSDEVKRLREIGSRAFASHAGPGPEDAGTGVVGEG